MLEQIQYFSFLIFVGIIPSLIWLFYFIRKDEHKEPTKTLIQIFLLGALSTVWALLLEALFLKVLEAVGIECLGCKGLIPDFLGAVNFQILSAFSFVIFIGLAFIEEASKYLVVKFRILKDKAFDEPVDAMIYLIVGALGFAAAENIGYIIAADPKDVLGILYLRFFTATFLHALTSAIVGYFFALSIIHKRNHFIFITSGILLATLAHALFNLLVTLMENSDFSFLYLVILMLFLFESVSYLFRRIKKIHYNMQNQ